MQTWTLYGISTPINMIEYLVIIVIHYIADFIFQAEEWAINKYKSLGALFSHTLTYSLVLMLLSVMFLKIETGHALWFFTVVNFGGHTIIDFFTSKIVSKKFRDKQLGSSIPNFGAFSIIGFDQVLHYTTLFVSYYLITR